MTRLLTVLEVAQYLRTTTTTVYRWLKQGKLQGVKIGKEWRIQQNSLEEMGFVFSEGEESPNTVWENLSDSEHLLVIAESRDEIFKLEASFFAHASQLGCPMFKGCWWQDRDEVKEQYNRYGLDTEVLEKENLLEIADFREAYDQNGVAGPVLCWKNAIEKSRDKKLWASGSPTPLGWKQEEKLIQFESSLNHEIRDKNVIGICPYAFEDFRQESVRNMLQLIEHHSGLIFYSGRASRILRTDKVLI